MKKITLQIILLFCVISVFGKESILVNQNLFSLSNNQEQHYAPDETLSFFTPLSTYTHLEIRDSLLVMYGAYPYASTQANKTFSKNENIYVEYKAGTNKQQVGFGKVGSYSYNGILNLNGTINIVEGGTIKNKEIKNYIAGDILRIEKKGDIIYYSKNGEVFFTKAYVEHNLGDSFYIGMSSSTQEGIIEGIKIGSPESFEAKLVNPLYKFDTRFENFKHVAENLITDTGIKFIDTHDTYTKQDVSNALIQGNYFYHLGITHDKYGFYDKAIEYVNNEYNLNVLEGEIISFGILIRNNTNQPKKIYVEAQLPSTEKNIIIRREGNLTEAENTFGSRASTTTLDIIGDLLTILPTDSNGDSYIELYPNEVVKLVVEFTGDNSLRKENYGLILRDSKIKENLNVNINMLNRIIPEIEMPAIAYDNKSKSNNNFADGFFSNDPLGDNNSPFFTLFKNRYRLGYNMVEVSKEGIASFLDIRNNISSNPIIIWADTKKGHAIQLKDNDNNNLEIYSLEYNNKYIDLMESIFKKVQANLGLNFPKEKMYVYALDEVTSNEIDGALSLYKRLSDEGFKTLVTIPQTSSEDPSKSIINTQETITKISQSDSFDFIVNYIENTKLNIIVPQSSKYQVWNYDSDTGRRTANIVGYKTHNLISVLKGNEGLSSFRFEDGFHSLNPVSYRYDYGLTYLSDYLKPWNGNDASSKIRSHWFDLTQNGQTLKDFAGNDANKHNLWYKMGTSSRLLAHTESVTLGKVIKYLQGLNNNNINNKLDEYLDHINQITVYFNNHNQSNNTTNDECNTNYAQCSELGGSRGVGPYMQEKLRELDNISNQIKQLYLDSNNNIFKKEAILEADTQTYNSSSDSNENYGRLSKIQVTYTPWNKQTLDSYLRFNIKDLEKLEEKDTAFLNLNIKFSSEINGEISEVSLFELNPNNITWDENEITFNNANEILNSDDESNLIDLVSVNADSKNFTLVQFNIKEVLNHARMNNKKHITFKLKADRKGDKTLFGFYSKEANMKSLAPRIEINRNTNDTLTTSSISFKEIEDAELIGGDKKNINYGNNDIVLIRHSNGGYDNTYSSGVVYKINPQNISLKENQIVKLVLPKKGGGLDELDVFTITKDWNEGSVTFSNFFENNPTEIENQSPFDNLYKTVTGIYGLNKVEVDITNLINKNKDSFSLYLRSSVANNYKNLQLYSTEISDISKHPHLVVKNINVSNRNISKEPTSFTKPISHIILYPNPTDGEVNVKANKDIKAFKIISLIGKVISIENFNTPKRIFTTSIYNQTNGIYIIQVQYTDGSTENKKIMKK